MALNTFPLVYFAVSRTIEAVGARYSDVGRVFWGFAVALLLPHYPAPGDAGPRGKSSSGFRGSYRGIRYASSSFDAVPL